MSDPKEALERLKLEIAFYSTCTEDQLRAQSYTLSGARQLAADLHALIAKQEGLEREVAYTENRRAHWQHEAEAEHSRAAALAIDYENMSINRDTLKARAEAADAQLSALQEAARNILPYLRWTVGPESPGHHPTMPSAVAAFQMAFDLDTPEKRTAATRRALLPTVPVEGS